jgi:hypothetical protein
MANTVMFLHGQGIKKSERLIEYLDLIRVARSNHSFLPLMYGPIVDSMGLFVLDRSDQSVDDSTQGYTQGYTEGWAEGYIARELGLEENAGELEPTGEVVENAQRNAYNTYSYSIRYLLRKNVQDAVLEEIKKQTLQHIRQLRLKPKSIALLAHSLGTVVALDLLASELRDYFYKYISVGSPLGMIAKVPLLNEKLLPSSLRKLEVEWVDVAAPNDLIAKVRISQNQGFSIHPSNIKQIAAKYTDPHSAYFFDKGALSEWIEYLNEA